MFKWRYLRSFRLDSHYILKILIIFNIFLGLYLLFLSTNYRRYVEYPRDNNKDVPVPMIKSDPLPYSSSSLNNINNDSKVAKIPPPADSNKDQEQSSKIDPIEPQNSIVNEINDKNKNNDQLIVDKVFDSNNRPVVQDLSNNNNADDSSYKRIEEDDKTLDENDKLRIEMLGAKPDEQNSIIHTDLDFFDNNKKSSNDKTSPEEQNINRSGVVDDNKIEIKDSSKQQDAVISNIDDNKDVINQIMDHNSHIKKTNNSKLIIPDNVNLELTAWTVETRGKYQVLKDYIPANIPIEPKAKTITLTTQGGPGFLHHAEQLCERWDGPISLSVYAPGDDFRLAINMIYYLRQCANKCIADQVFWHLIYDVAYPPSQKISGPTSFLEKQKFDCTISLDQTMKSLKIDSDFRRAKSLPYPINVLRNVARLQSKSKYLLASDIELYPSIGIIPAFFEMLEREQNGLIKEINPRLPHVYTLPIFEVKAGKKPPKTKQELSKLFASKDAIFFHRYVCDECQNFPDRNIWINEIPKDNSMNIFRVTKRTRERNQWEPLYIGTNDEPFYDERLTWEGKRDKMSQMFQMCLMNYDLLILDNAFLVHAPGIKRYSVKDDQKRLFYIKQNQKIYTSVLADLRKKYGPKNHC